MVYKHSESELGSAIDTLVVDFSNGDFVIAIHAENARDIMIAHLP